MKPKLKNIEKKLNVAFEKIALDMKLTKIPTGIMTLDHLLTGGWPQGRLIEIYGEEATGKSTIVYTTMIHLAKQSCKILFIDEENSFDPEYARALGLDRSAAENITKLRSETGEQCLNAIIEAIASKEFEFVILDSIAALTPKDEAIGAHARMLTLKLRKINKLCQETKTTVIMTNQIRHALKGLIAHLITTGGNALKHYASLRIALLPIDKTSKSILTKIQITKSKVGIPFKEGLIRIIFGAGVDRNYDLVESAVQTGKIERKGNKFIINGKLVQFKTALSYLKENEEKVRELPSEQSGGVPEK